MGAGQEARNRAMVRAGEDVHCLIVNFLETGSFLFTALGLLRLKGVGQLPIRPDTAIYQLPNSRIFRSPYARVMIGTDFITCQLVCTDRTRAKFARPLTRCKWFKGYRVAAKMSVV